MKSLYTTGTGINPDFETDLLRLDYTSLTTPNTTYDYNVKTKKLKTEAAGSGWKF